ncbi:MAG: phytanoyl-CoA dioxygenase family protein, partial [Candidatus Poribacteria bacterium]|nr:phytanoyl-CoA dioxygenase family protein [Candidatus Poribacteria bacterium]
EVSRLAPAVDALEAHARKHLTLPPRKKALWGPDYHADESGYFVHGSYERGQTLLIEDFWNVDPAFDLLANHEKTMRYIKGIVRGELGVNNSELRVRYPGNATGTHMGGPIATKYKYAVTEGHIDCMMVRFIYFVHDVNEDEGVFCVVPGTHKSLFRPPYTCPVDEEPGMVGLPVKAGDAVLFTENLRHGGFTNRSEQTRKTLHVGYGPAWMMSQNIATMDERPHITPETWARYDDGQRKLFQPWLRKPPEYSE